MYIWGKGQDPGRVGSGQTFCRQSRVGSGQVSGFDGSGPRKVARGQLCYNGFITSATSAVFTSNIMPSTYCVPAQRLQLHQYSTSVQFCPKHATYRRKCKCCVTYLLTALSSIHPTSCSEMESMKGLKNIFRSTIQLNPFTKSWLKLRALVYFLTISRVFLKKRRSMLRQKMHSLKMHQNCW